jgi:hypothetical protein
MTMEQSAEMNETEYIIQKKRDGYISRDIGAIIDMLLKNNADMTMQTAFKTLYGSQLYANLVDHKTCYYLLDTLELYNKLKAEVE